MTDDKHMKDERDLDQMLDLVAPPAPSEILRARLLRDFAPGMDDGNPGRAGIGAALRARLGATLTARLGALAVAAALVLAVALGLLLPPDQAGPVGAVASLADIDDARYDAEIDAESDEESPQLAYDEEAPDSAAFMVAALYLGRDGDESATDGADSFEGLPLD